MIGWRRHWARFGRALDPGSGDSQPQTRRWKGGVHGRRYRGHQMTGAVHQRGDGTVATPKLGTVCSPQSSLWFGCQGALGNPLHYDLPLLNGFLPYWSPWACVSCGGPCTISGLWWWWLWAFGSHQSVFPRPRALLLGFLPLYAQSQNPAHHREKDMCAERSDARKRPH